MPTDNYPVAQGADDWEITWVGADPPVTDDNNDEIVVRNNQIVSTTSVGIFKIDTTDFEDLGTITGMTFYVNEQSYTKSRGVSVQKAIEIDNPYPTAYYRFSDTSTYTFGLNGYALDATAEGHVNNSGYTYFRLKVDSPGASKHRTWTVLAFEAYTEGGYEAYLAIDYEGAGGSRHRAYFF